MPHATRCGGSCSTVFPRCDKRRGRCIVQPNGCPDSSGLPWGCAHRAYTPNGVSSSPRFGGRFLIQPVPGRSSVRARSQGRCSCLASTIGLMNGTAVGVKRFSAALSVVHCFRLRGVPEHLDFIDYSPNYSFSDIARPQLLDVLISVLRARPISVRRKKRRDHPLLEC